MNEARSPQTYHGPDAYALADWRRRINDLYAAVRATRDARAGWALWHETRSHMFQCHPMSPLPKQARSGHYDIPVFPYDPSLRFEVSLDPVTGATPLQFDLGADGPMQARPVARTRGLQRLGAELTLYWIEGYGGGLFLPFRDATNGHGSYGGGRYLIDAIKGADLGLNRDGRLICDFNFAYTPSCAFSDGYVCPLSPAENTLPQPVRAGERFETAAPLNR